MQKRTGWRLLGVALLLALTSVTAMLGPARQAEAADYCCPCHDAWCYSRCYDQCGSDQGCLNACVDQCWYWDQLCMQNCPYPIC